MFLQIFNLSIAGDKLLIRLIFFSQLLIVTTPEINPQSNGMVENFVKALKRDYAKLAQRPDSQKVMVQQPKWFADYNSYHPHSALGYLPVKLFRQKRTVN